MTASQGWAHGLLLIDEIDLHLHPVWQRLLRTFVEKTFPNMQLLVTTHSPLTVQQSGPEELHILRRIRARSPPFLERYDGIPNRMMLHQLLLSPIFNLASMDSVKVEKKRAQYRSLKAKTALSGANEKQLHELKTSLEDLPNMTEGLSRFEHEHVEVLEAIRRELAAPKGGQQ